MTAPRRVGVLHRLSRVLRGAVRALAGKGRPRSHGYWERRYRRGGISGPGSTDRLADFKAEVVNDIVGRHALESVTEWGCGDGSQLFLARYPMYVGYDVSPTAVRTCREKFRGDPTKSFALVDEYAGGVTDAALSLDVIFHLVEDESFESYMRRLFDSAARIVVVYSSDTDENPEARDHSHVRHRKFSDWIAEHRPEWHLTENVPNRYPFVVGDLTTSFADFFVYARRTT
jgi:hypothetical protein